ncbi:MAG TPA: pyridoxamine 5'-phosphate oxidase family protein [Acidimicrobiales bacterium]|nr:pyridoxamine 5'-phosphate oxidase family protein [Acidimicrobiales bacterium]
MPVTQRHIGLEEMPPIGCDRHLRTETIGRVAIVVDGHPEIFPVNYAVDERGDIFFRTDPGTKLAAVATAPTIAFEIDGVDEEHRLGWSVLAVGPARWLSTPEQLEHVRALALEPWAAGEKANVVRLSPVKVTGRRIYRGRKADTEQEE